jgi:Cysteine rich repeat
MAHGIARWSLVIVILFLVGPAALAQTGPTTTQPVPWRQGALFRMDCGQDLRRFCSGVQPGEGRLIQCLSSHRSQLSPACISRVAAARPSLGVVAASENMQRPVSPSVNLSTGQTASALRASCGPDAQKLCGGIQRENGGVVKCLSSHRTELSPTCEAFFKEILVRRAAQKGAPKITPAAANGPVVIPAPDRAAKTAAPSAANGPADTGGPSAPDGSIDTTAPSAASGPTETTAPSAAGGPADTAAPSAPDGSIDTTAPSAASGPTQTAPSVASGPADTAAPSAANGGANKGAASAVNPSGRPAAVNEADDTDALSPANGPAATPVTTSGAAVTLTPTPPAIIGPATTSALPAANATNATAATPAAKKPTARGALDFPL